MCGMYHFTTCHASTDMFAGFTLLQLFVHTYVLTHLSHWSAFALAGCSMKFATVATRCHTACMIFACAQQMDARFCVWWCCTIVILQCHMEYYDISDSLHWHVWSTSGIPGALVFFVVRNVCTVGGSSMLGWTTAAAQHDRFDLVDLAGCPFVFSQWIDIVAS